ncbi:MAG: LON peptidase substrate-binding domain-containing protein [Phreatobacter sp.]|uniref:LON peptidase substrate-binding domain-containing protein n=1 Tax=Phreatobacter sp. TaxID=1966341 RepID=UPI0027330738|nr:LON peptidase substrate-binding domain-containing protein [Phreatobacter sp.]MDP2803205.1 LON peptidase substrate-binding domain-containing protein [Phreatobacter sp.]
MATNTSYLGPADLPDVIPVFPLPGALLLPRGQLPLNIFEPRYLAMIDDAFLSGRRLIGMVQPVPADEDARRPTLSAVGCVGRITQLAESGDGRYMLSLTGITRFRIVEELSVTTPYRQCKIDCEPYQGDFEARVGEDDVDRDGLLKTLKEFLEVNDMEADWDGIRRAPTEILVNALCMMSPWGLKEKQALLEAPDLKTRAALLVAVTEVALAKDRPADDKQPLN